MSFPANLAIWLRSAGFSPPRLAGLKPALHGAAKVTLRSTPGAAIPESLSYHFQHETL